MNSLSFAIIREDRDCFNWTVPEQLPRRLAHEEAETEDQKSVGQQLPDEHRQQQQWGKAEKDQNLLSVMTKEIVSHRLSSLGSFFGLFSLSLYLQLFRNSFRSFSFFLLLKNATHFVTQDCTLVWLLGIYLRPLESACLSVCLFVRIFFYFFVLDTWSSVINPVKWKVTHSQKRLNKTRDKCWHFVLSSLVDMINF